MIKAMLRRVEHFVNRLGYRISWAPRVFLEKPEAELTLELKYVLAHLMLKKSNVFFVNIGAHDGRSNDPVWEFVKRYQWHGVLVEPQKDVFERLKANYSDSPQLMFQNVAIATENGRRTMYKVKSGPGVPEFATQFTSFRRESVLSQTRYIPNVGELIDTEEVECITLDTLLQRAGAVDVDVLQIDAEGYDYEIVMMVDFKRVRPSVIHFEHVHLTKNQQETCCRLLIDNGYRVARTNLNTVAYLDTLA
jgi:FkbM family methyltransferase